MSGRSRAVTRLEAAIGGRLALTRIESGRTAGHRAPTVRIDDRFEVRAILGTGSFGSVVRAWDPQVGREVAIKCIPVEDPWRMFEIFAPEAQALAKVEAPEVVRVYDCRATSVDVGSARLPCLALIMELVRGVNLRSWSRSASDPDARLATLISAAKGLEAAHAAGVIHRDFKPENVMVTEDRLARIVDFGLAYRAASMATSQALVARGQFGIGTTEYMAPEMFDGTITLESDQFAFAVTAWEVLTGTRPFDPKTATWRAAKPHDFNGARELPQHLLTALGRALRCARQERFASISELRAALENQGGYGRLAATIAGVAGVAVLGAIATTTYIAKRDKG